MKLGDLVIQMTGGYLMTIEKVKGELVDCMWFDMEMFLCRSQFPKSTLIPIDGPTSYAHPVYASLHGVTIRR